MSFGDLGSRRDRGLGAETVSRVLGAEFYSEELISSHRRR